MSFLPETYTVPESASGYMKLKQGSNRFRILSPAIVGFEYWNKENKPVRSRENWDLIPQDIKLASDGMPTPIKHFWAFVVWNYNENLVQILEITQATIQRGLKIKIDNREGKATDNDFIITRTGEGMDTEYDIDVAEASPLKAEIEIAYKAKKIDLEALFSGGDPFATTMQNQPVESKSEASTKAVNPKDIHYRLLLEAHPLFGVSIRIVRPKLIYLH